MSFYPMFDNQYSTNDNGNTFALILEILVCKPKNLIINRDQSSPCVVLSPDEINHNLRTVVIAPMTTKSRSYPTRVKGKHNNQVGWVVIDQISTIDKVRVVKVLGNLNPSEVASRKSVIKETFVDQ